MINNSINKNKFKYERVTHFLLNCERFIKENEIESASHSLRLSLEIFVKIICKDNGILTSEDDATIELNGMINSLKELNLFTNDEINLFHEIKNHTNPGTHGNVSDATNELTKSYCSAWRMYLVNNNCYIEPKGGNVNVPLDGSSFYLQGKRTYGMWSECQSREDLLTIPEYVELKKKADSGDVDAMIDIALGFLDKSGGIRTSDFGLMCMPKIKKYGKYFFNENNRDYNVLYYHWINLAAKTACEKNKEGEFYSKRLIATALLESIKFSFISNVGVTYNYLYDVDSKRIKNTEEYEYFPKYRNQSELAQKMFDIERICYSNIYSTSKLLFDFIDEYGNEIISPMHKERDKSTIRYLVYAYIYYYCSVYPKEYQDYILKENMYKGLLINVDEDSNNTVTQDTLKKYNDTNLKNKIYEFVVENTKKKILERRGFDVSGYSLLDLIKMANDNYGAAKELYKQRKKVGFESIEKEIESLEKVCSFSSATAEDYENLAMVLFGVAVSRVNVYESKFFNACEKAMNLGSIRAKRILLNYYSMYVDCVPSAYQVSEVLANEGDIYDKYCHYIMLYSRLYSYQSNIQILKEAWKEELLKNYIIKNHPVLADFVKQISPDKLKGLFDYVHDLSEPSREAYAVLLTLVVFDGNRNSQLLLSEANRLKLVNANDFQYSAYIYNLLYNRRFYRNNLATTGNNVLGTLSEGFNNYVKNRASENTIRGVLYSGLSDFLKNI